jgi:hypothetical protein
VVVQLGLLKVFALIIVAGSLATAADFSFTGSLAADDAMQLFRFTLTSASTVTVRTYSYAGGTTQADAIVPRGGFDPVLGLFDSAGVLINENDDGYANVSTDAITGQPWDSYLYTTLAAGTYTVSLTQYDSFPNGPNLSNDFSGAGKFKFTGGFNCSNGGFCDRTGDNRTANWEMDVLGAITATTVPEPGLPALLITGIVFISALHLRKRSHEWRKI